jgi:ATP-binding cassette subfamily B protein
LSLPLQILNAVLRSAKPFVNIIFTAKIVGELLGAGDVGTLVNYVISAVILNLAIGIASSITSTLSEITTYPKMYLAEKNKAAMKLFSVDYEKLEDKKFDEKTRKYKESLNGIGSHFGYFSWAVSNMFFGLTSFGVALSVLIPLFTVSFQSTGDSFIESPSFALLVFGVMALLIVGVFFLNKRTQKMYFNLKDQYLNLSKIFEYYLETVTDYKNGKEIRIFGEQNLIEKDASHHLIEKGVKIRKKTATTTGLNTSVIAVIGAIAGFAVYAFIGLKGLVKTFPVEDIVMYTGSFLIIVSGLTEIFTQIGAFVEILQTVGYYFDIIDTENQRAGEMKTESVDTENLTVEFQNVSFKYPGSEAYALKNFSIKINPKEHLAIVGQNGSGKTTFIKLLTKMYDDYEGEIFVNGINMREYDTDDYRKIFAVVFQDYKIFSFKISDNITCGGEYDEKKIFECMDAAGLGARVSRLPHGIDTYLYKDCNDDGVEISGGESQKFALARALYKDAPFIILDEPTASLDPVAEYELYSKFNGLVGDKTAVYISHRLSSCRFCEKIAVFEKGALVQYGKHEDLIKDEKSKYFELWTAQARYYV